MEDFSGPSLGFSGPRHVGLDKATFIRERFRAVLLEVRPREATSGCALGCDTIGIEEAEDVGVPLLRLTLPRVFVSPTAPFSDFRILKGNAALADRVADEIPKGSGRWEIEYGKICRHPGEAFLARDDLTVARSEILAAAPKTSREELRSGTWSTIRRMRKKGGEIRFFPLDGSEPWVEPAAARLFP